MKFDSRTNARDEDSDLLFTVTDWTKAGYIAKQLHKVYGPSGITFMRTEKNIRDVELSCIGCNSDGLYREILGYARALGDFWDRFMLSE